MPVAITQEGYQLQDKLTRKGPWRCWKREIGSPLTSLLGSGLLILALEKSVRERSVTDGGQCLSRLTALPDDG